MNKNEIRTGTGGLYQPHLRETEDGKQSRTITGYAIVFGQESEILVDWDGAYREIIEPGAVTEEDLRGWDIQMTIWHNRERLLARWRQGEGSLKLGVDQQGVWYEFESPNTPDGDTAIELVKRGDLVGASFTYWTDEGSNVRYEKTDEKILLRHVDRISFCNEMTLASNPAFQQTTAEARELTEKMRELTPDPQPVPDTVDTFKAEADKQRREMEILLKHTKNF